MTEDQANDTKAADAAADEPIPDAADGASTNGTSEGHAANARAREWIAQLETMIQDIATQAAPVARQVGAKAAELAAVAAVKAGPLAQKAADVTTDVGQRFAERAQSVAAELRATPGSDTAAADGDVSTEPPAPPAEGDGDPTTSA